MVRNRYLNKTAFIAFMIAAICGICGCTAQDVQQNIEEIARIAEQPQTNSTQSGQEAQETEEDVQSLQEPAQTEQEQEEEPEQLADIYYAYHTLDKPDKKLYLEIWHALEGMEGEVKVSTFDEEALNRIFHCVLADHPELFYVEGYQYTRYTMGDKLAKLTFTGTYSMSEDEMHQTLQQIDASAEAILTSVADISDQYEIVKILYDTLIRDTEYDLNAENNQNITSVLLQGRSVCQGYAKTMQYLLQRKGIQALLVTGYTNGEGHAWNLVRVNGAYYYLDPTWGDASYTRTDTGDSFEGQVPPINYDYFLVTTQELNKTHRLETVMELPECTATEDNYYIHEGLYLDSYNEDVIEMIFENAALDNSSYVTMKCSDDAVYTELQTRLIGNQEVFRFLGGKGASIAYTTNQEQLTVSFWI